MVSYDKKNIGSKGTKNRLNPYCSGRWSRTDIRHTAMSARQVLILIVVEDGLVQAQDEALKELSEKS